MSITEIKQDSKTDVLIEKLYTELSFLSQKVGYLESNKIDKEDLSKELANQHLLMDDLENQYEKQQESYKENIKIALKMVQKIQDPISAVSKSLKKISVDTREVETKKSLDSCLTTLEKLKKQCSNSNYYFDTLLKEKKFLLEKKNLQKLFTKLQKHPLYHFLEIPTLPSKTVIITWELLEFLHYEIFQFLYQEAILDKKISVKYKEIPAEVALNNQSNICISFLFTTKTNLVWNKLWENSLRYNEEEKDKIPLQWFHWKKYLNQYQGEFFVEEEKKVTGFSFSIPFQETKTNYSI